MDIDIKVYDTQSDDVQRVNVTTVSLPGDCIQNVIRLSHGEVDKQFVVSGGKLVEVDQLAGQFITPLDCWRALILLAAEHRFLEFDVGVNLPQHLHTVFEAHGVPVRNYGGLTYDLRFSDKDGRAVVRPILYNGNKYIGTPQWWGDYNPSMSDFCELMEALRQTLLAARFKNWTNCV